MKTGAGVALWILASAALVAGLYFFRDTLTQFALALVLWLGIDTLTRFLDKHIPFMSRAFALPLALALVLGAVTIVCVVIARNVGVFAANANGYEARLNQIIAELFARFQIPGPAPTVGQAIRDADPATLVAQIGQGIRGIASDLIFILIYLGFLFPAAAMMSGKLDVIFPDPSDRQHARDVLASIRKSIDRYLSVQTQMSLLISLLTYGTLVLIGLENALFWSFLIFFLNYIPTIGSIVAVVLPTAFALIQFPDLASVGLVAAGVGFWQFAIGNFVQPRLTGESLNLSAVVVLLALALWGSVWGIAGAFLAAPLTVMIMIVCAQFPSTHWISVLLSADGRPAIVHRSARENSPAA